MVICGACWVKAWMTMRPRASEVMKLGSPVKTSSEAAGDILVGAGTGSSVNREMGSSGDGVRRGERLIRYPHGRLKATRAKGACDSRTISTINGRGEYSQAGWSYSRGSGFFEKTGELRLRAA